MFIKIERHWINPYNITTIDQVATDVVIYFDGENNIRIFDTKVENVIQTIYKELSQNKFNNKFDAFLKEEK